MILAIDTNILLDVLIPNTANLESSLTCLTSLNHHDELIICEAVFAELGSQFLSFRDLDTFLKDVGINLVSSSETALFEASTAWRKYSTRNKELLLHALYVASIKDSTAAHATSRCPIDNTSLKAFA